MGHIFIELIHSIQARNEQFALKLRGGGAACSSSGSWSSAWGTDLGCIPPLVLLGCSLLQCYTHNIPDTEKPKELATMSLASPKVEGYLSPFSAFHVSLSFPVLCLVLQLQKTQAWRMGLLHLGHKKLLIYKFVQLGMCTTQCGKKSYISWN